MKKKALDIIFEDDHLVVVNKPSGLLVIPDRQQNPNNLQDLLRQKYGDIFIVHRIDRDTSGLVVFAKTKEAHAHLCQQFEARSTKKIYWALVKGNLRQEEGEIEAAIDTKLNSKGMVKISDKGKAAHSSYKRLEQLSSGSLVEVQIHTGRLHQIRIHMKSIGYPLLIDPIYGEAIGVFLSDYKKNFNVKKGQEERPVIDRLTLHAFSLTLTHPVSQETISFEAPLHKDFKVAIKQLKVK